MNPAEKEQYLSGLFARYREATEVPDVSAAFSPGLWKKIGARRASSFRLERWTRIFASSAVGLAVLAGLFVSLQPAGLGDDSFVEALVNQNLAANGDYFEPVRLSPVAGQGTSTAPAPR